MKMNEEGFVESTMEDKRISKLGIGNFIFNMVLIITISMIYVLTKDSLKAWGLPVASLAMLLLVPVWWIQYWIYIRQVERIEGGGA
jgi:hypothetical protein